MTVDMNWTVDPKTGRSNSSKEFEECVRLVGRLIRNSGFDLLAGRTDAVARLIVAQLAHVQKLEPPRTGDTGSRPDPIPPAGES